MEGKLLSYHHNVVKALKPGCWHSASILGRFLPCAALGVWCLSQATYPLPLLTLSLSVSDAQRGIPVNSLFRVLLESSEDFLNYKNSPGPSCSEDANLSPGSRIYFRASLKLFVLFYSESRKLPLGTVKYALALFSWAHVYISAWKSPLSLLRIYIAKVAISQAPCSHYGWYDLWDKAHLKVLQNISVYTSWSVENST